MGKGLKIVFLLIACNFAEASLPKPSFFVGKEFPVRSSFALNGRFLFFPDYDLIESGKKRYFFFFLSIYDRKYRSLGHWKRRGEMPFDGGVGQMRKALSWGKRESWWRDALTYITGGEVSLRRKLIAWSPGGEVLGIERVLKKGDLSVNVIRGRSFNPGKMPFWEVWMSGGYGMEFAWEKKESGEDFRRVLLQYGQRKLREGWSPFEVLAVLMDKKWKSGEKMEDFLLAYYERWMRGAKEEVFVDFLKNNILKIHFAFKEKEKRGGVVLKSSFLPRFKALMAP